MFYPNSAVYTMHKQAVAFSAGPPTKLQRQMDPRRHRYAPSRTHIFCCQFGIAARDFFGLFKEDIDALPRNLFNAGLLYHKPKHAEWHGSVT
jgi:hypothetical protein